MFGLNAILDYQVITPRGMRWVRSLTNGDQLYEYGTGKLLTYRGQRIGEVSEVYQIDYNDGRNIIANKNDPIYIGDGRITTLNRMSLWANYRKIVFRGEIEHPPLDFHRMKHLNGPDPYVTGALWFGGDWEDEEMNLPINMTEMNGVLAHKYNIEHADQLKKGKVYFRYLDSSQPIRWDQFFAGYNWYPVNHHKDADIIPREIMFGTLKERQEFLMAVFDVGFQLADSPIGLEVTHTNEQRLQVLQHMMSGMGILSKITMDKPKSAYDIVKYRLSVLGDPRQYPGLLYDAQKIEGVINFQRQVDITPKFQFQIKAIHPVNSPIPVGRGVVPTIRLDKKNAVFYDGNYLPRVAL